MRPILNPQLPVALTPLEQLPNNIQQLINSLSFGWNSNIRANKMLLAAYILDLASRLIQAEKERDALAALVKSESEVK